MARQARKHSSSKVYHVMYKGIDGQDIFYEEIDRRIFLNKLEETKKEYGFKIFSYCLMTNHVHLVIEIENEIFSNSMKSIGIKYASYFNKKYLRSGSLFQDRFNSKCVENQKYFIDVCRYVEKNPEKAKICKTQYYKWNSYNEYIGKERIIDKKVLLHYFNNSIDKYKSFIEEDNGENEFDFLEYELKTKFDDDQLAKYIINKLNLNNIHDITKTSKEELKQCLEIFKDLKYTNISQISRVTRISRWHIEKMLKN